MALKHVSVPARHGYFSLHFPRSALSLVDILLEFPLDVL